jgi:hypothetical protein
MGAGKLAPAPVISCALTAPLNANVAATAISEKLNDVFIDMP